MVSESDCLFCKIIRGEIPCRKVYEDESVIAFLDINPASRGHTLVVPKKHATDILDADEKSLSSALSAAKKIAKAIKEKLNAEGINVLQNNGQRAGQLVHHVHFHVIPRYANDNIMLAFPRAPATPEQLDEAQKLLSVKEKAEKSDDYVDWKFR